MLQSCLGQTVVAAWPQAEGSNALGDRAFDTGPVCVLFLPLLGVSCVRRQTAFLMRPGRRREEGGWGYGKLPPVPSWMPGPVRPPYGRESLTISVRPIEVVIVSRATDNTAGARISCYELPARHAAQVMRLDHRPVVTGQPLKVP